MHVRDPNRDVTESWEIVFERSRGPTAANDGAGCGMAVVGLWDRSRA